MLFADKHTFTTFTTHGIKVVTGVHPHSVDPGRAINVLCHFLGLPNSGPYFLDSTQMNLESAAFYDTYTTTSDIALDNTNSIGPRKQSSKMCNLNKLQKTVSSDHIRKGTFFVTTGIYEMYWRQTLHDSAIEVPSYVRLDWASVREATSL